jgi:hypothetical protein
MTASVGNRKWRLRAAAALLGLIAAACLFAGFYTVRAHAYYKAHQFQMEGRLLEEDLVIGFRQVPNNTWRHTGNPKFTVHTDAGGARVAQPGGKVPTSVDVLGIGGSFTWGHGMELEETFLHLLGKEFDLTSYNAALASYGTTAALLTLRKLAHLKPKLVVYGFIEDHIARSMVPSARCSSPFMRPVAFVDLNDAGKPFVHDPLSIDPHYFEYLDEMVLRHDFGWTDFKWAVRRDYMALTGKDKRGLLSPYYQRTHDSRLRQRVVSFLMEEMRRECREIGAKLLVVYLPVPSQIRPPSPEFMSAVRPASGGSDAIEFLDMAEPFAQIERSEGKRALCFANDIHPNRRANQVIAKELVSAARSLLQR